MNRTCIALVLSLATVVLGCRAEQPSQSAYVPPPVTGKQLVSAKQTEDLGVIPLGYQQAIAFPVSNPSERPLKLSVVHSSCACLDATIDQRELPARGSTTVRAKVHATDTSTPGPFAAEIRIAAMESKGDRFSCTFGIRAVIEGLLMEPAIARIPRSTSSWRPTPLRGTFYLDKTKGDIDITDLEWSAAGVPKGVVIGEPKLSPVRDLGDHAMRQLTVPLLVEAPLRPVPGIYEGWVVYRAHGLESRTKFVLQVVDALE